MRHPDARAVRGFLADADTGSGLGGLTIELWSVTGHVPQLIARDQSDISGYFSCAVPGQQFTGRDFLDVELRVHDEDRRLLSDIRPIPATGRLDPIELSVPRAPSLGTSSVDFRTAPDRDDPANGVGTVSGRVRGTIPPGAKVRVVVKTLRDGNIDQQTAAESAVTDRGAYRISYDRHAVPAGGDSSLHLQLFAPDRSEVIGESAPVLGLPEQARIDVRAGRRSVARSEYALIAQEITEGLSGGVAALDGSDESVIEEVSDWIDIDPNRVLMFREAQTLGDTTGLPPAIFYALQRNGIAPSIGALIDVPIDELRTTVAEAAADGIVDAESTNDIDTALERLADHVVDRAVHGEVGTRPVVAEILAAADIPEATIEAALRRYQRRTGAAADFWESLGETDEVDAALDATAAGNVREAIKVSEMVGPDIPVLRQLHSLRRDGRWRTPEDLCSLAFDEWCALLEDVEAGSNAEQEVDGEDSRASVEAQAEAILDTLEENFPNRFLRDRFVGGEELSSTARGLIERASDHDFHRASIRERLAIEPALAEGIDDSALESAIEEVEAIERVSRCTDHAEEAALLIGTGMRSAMDIASCPERQFIELYAESLGGRAQASRVHAQAQQTAAGSKVVSVRLLQALQQAPFVLGGPPPDVLKNAPDAKTLFQASGGFCDCEHCGSVYSPAAYFVDLLRYLNVSTPERLEQIQKRLANRDTAPAITQAIQRQQPLDVLLARRPDLAELSLTCENTLTALPYIDLVNELLEARIAGTSAAHDTGKVPSDVLRAVPQHLSRPAYLLLQQAIHPVTLPYHQPLQLARAYLAHLGVTRLELVRTLGRGDGLRDALSAEALLMSPEEYAIVVNGPAEPWRHYGFVGPEQNGISYVDALKHVPAFLNATGITFQDLIDLVSTRFLNADRQLVLETPTPDCNPDIIRIAGLDAPRLAGMLRLIRLQRRLGWSFTILDRVLIALQASDLDAVLLEKVAIARELATRLGRPVTELLALWAPIDTFGKNSEFERLFATRAVAWRTQDEKAFTLRQDHTELLETGPSLDSLASALLAAFRITSEELASIRAIQVRRGSEPRLDLPGLSAIYRVVVLARALQLRIPALDLLLRLVPPEADPFTPADPAATRRFVEIVREVQASDFTPERLAYIFRHESEPRRDPGPLPAQVDGVLASIRRGLADAFSETTRPADLTSDVLRQKLATLVDPALLDPAIEVLDPRTPLIGARRREFFTRHLARIFPDPTVAAARLFEGLSSPGTASESPSAPAGATGEANPLEQRWKANIEFVLDHLLPQLRARQLRGAVVQTLSDTIGMSVPSTARLLDGVLKSRRQPGEPLLRDFLALLGTGLTGSYYGNADLSGEPKITRLDSEINFAWSGASPAEGVPGQGFSARWTGHLLPKAKAPHTFYVQTDGAVRLTITIDRTERVLIDRPASARAGEHASEPIALDANQLVGIRLEYRNHGNPASLVLQYGTGPVAKQAVPATSLYPAEGLASFAPVHESYRRLHKASLIITGFGATDSHLEWLTGTPLYLNFDTLPMAPGGDAVALFRRWRQLAALYALHKKLPKTNVDLIDVFRATTLPEALDRLVLATGWDRATIEALLAPDGLAIASLDALRPPKDPTVEPAMLKLARAMDVQRRVGVAPATLSAWANAVPDADAAATIVQAVKARYDEARWLEVARTLNDPLRAERRDALVAYLLPRMRDVGVTTRNQLFEYFLIDVDMNPCMMSSRIRQAAGAVQTFFQRALMNLEPKVPPRIIDERDWKWLKSYRVWEANRKVFLYPENWIEPELRDDKSPLFLALESSILQQEIKNDNVEAAFADYLEGLDEIARLDVRGVWFEERPTHRMVERPVPSPLRVPSAPRSEWDHGTYHIFARTFNAPHLWYYRRLENGRQWTAWEKIDADIEGEHLLPVVFNRRMHLFWTMFREVNKKVPDMKRDSKGPPPPLGKDWEIQLAYSVYDRGKWSRKRMSTGGVVDVLDFIHTDIPNGKTERNGSCSLAQSDYTLRATVNDASDLPQLHVHLYRRAVEAVAGGAPRLAATGVTRLGRFALNGCNGALAPDHSKHSERPYVTVQPLGKRHALRAALGGRGRTHKPSVVGGSFQIASSFTAPTGYQISGMGFAASNTRSGPLLALPAGDARGVSVALPAGRASRYGVRVLPVINSAQPEQGGLYPFFFQDAYRSYFVRPIYTDWRSPRLVASPLIAQRPVPRVTSPTRKPRPGTPGRGGRGRREDIDDVIDVVPELVDEARDAWEDAEDGAWHPDDAAEARPPRTRARTAAPPAKPRPTTKPAATPTPPLRKARATAVGRVRPALMRQVAGYHERLLHFAPFEHPDTCRFIATLKAKGIEGLLDFSTTRPPRGKDHVFTAQGQWQRAPQTWFQRQYGAGPLIYTTNLPHLDVGFEADHPYAIYNWELFFHAPLQVAVRLAKDGRHEEAQRWFHFIFDPTTDSSAPSPKRYWRFAPFYENHEYDSARQLMQLLSYGQGATPADPALVARQAQVRAQLSAWWEKPFSPHVIARLRVAAYQKAVVMKYIDNLVEWGDKLFRRDTLETIQEATQLYILAANILGPRPEKVPPIVEKQPLTFKQMRDSLNLFSNLEVRIENLQVRRPFRISAQPDRSGASSVLSMATQYFCTPPNPQLDKVWDTVADRLHKIRNCMNIQGIVRQLPLFEPPIDPGVLVRAAAAGVDLGSVIASLNAPPPNHRFRFLLDRAVRLAEEIRSFGAMLLRVLEKKDADALAALRASHEAALLDAVREIRKKQVKQVEEEMAELALQREQVDLQVQHHQTLVTQLMNAQETAEQTLRTASKVASGVAEGIDLVAKVMHAIPDFQTGAAGAFSSPFVTLQLGGQMFGDIAEAFAASVEKIKALKETEADLAGAQAEFQRRREEWQHLLDVLLKERSQVDKRVVETQLKIDITGGELRRHDLEVENSRKVQAYFRDKYTNDQLYGWMLGQLSTVYFQAYKVAFDAAQQAERAFRFERGDQSTAFIEFSYWDSLKKGLFAGERLLLDLRRMEAAYTDGDRRALEITRHVSLRDDLPLAFVELLSAGRCQIDITEALLDGDFPGHYFRRIKAVSLTVQAPIKPQRNINCTLTLLENRLRLSGNATGAYAQAADADDSRFLMNPVPVHAVATSRPDSDPGLFRLSFDDARYLPFEGAGAISKWRLELPQADNAIDLSSITDVVMSVSYTARSGGAALEAVARADREKGLARGGITPEPRQYVSLRRDFPLLWTKLQEAAAGREIELPLTLDADRFSGRYRGLDLRIERATVFLQPRRALTADALQLRLDPPKGSGTQVTGWLPPWPRSRAMRATAEVSGSPGLWKLAVTLNQGTVADLVDDLVLIFELRARQV